MSGCTTVCDTDCEVACHEGHQPQWKRDHEPSSCPAKVTDGQRETIEDWVWRRESAILDLPETPGHRAAFLAGARPDVDALLDALDGTR